MKLIDNLKRHGWKIATAESCTGGLLAKTITDYAGSSDVFEFGAVVYSNKFKNKLLGVSNDVLNTYGAVSEQTAYALSKGICEYSEAEVGVGITGIAGPGGGTSEKPVGLVYYSIYIEQKNIHICEKLLLSGNREQVRQQTVLAVIKKLEEIL